MAGHRPFLLDSKQRKLPRRLTCEPLERRDLLAIALAGVQTVDLWDMAVASQLLRQTEARFTLTGSAEQAGQAVAVNWGDGSAPFQGAFNDQSKAAANHTFAKGTFTVTITCGAEVTPYTFQSSTMAIGQRPGSGADSLFLVGDAMPNPVVITNSAPGTLMVMIANPWESRQAPSTIAGIYGSLLGGNDSVTISPSLATPTYFSLGDGNDIFFGGAGNDMVIAGAGNDVLYGNNGNDVFSGGAGNDLLYGGAGNDLIEAGAGVDLVFGGSGNDDLFGGDGNDVLYGESGNDLLEGDEGDDVLAGGAGQDLLYGSAGNDNLDGGDGDDWLFGELGQDLLFCCAGNDVGIGGAGADQIFGGLGNDLLGGGNDFTLCLRTREALAPILPSWAVNGQIPPELSDPNLAIWDDGDADLMIDGIGRTLFYVGQRDTAIGSPLPGSDVRVASAVPTNADVARIDYTTTSGIVNPGGTAGKTTLILGRFGADMGPIIQKLSYRNTVDFGARPRSFQILNVPNALNITSDQFWADYNQPLLDRSVARGDVILGATVPSSGGGYGHERDYLAALGYEYDPVTHQFVRTG